MTSARLIIQTIILACIFGIAAFLIFSTPEDTDPAWFRTLMLTKISGAAMMWGYVRLHRRWMKDSKSQIEHAQQDFGQSGRTPAPREARNHC